MASYVHFICMGHHTLLSPFPPCHCHPPFFLTLAGLLSPSQNFLLGFQVVCIPLLSLIYFISPSLGSLSLLSQLVPFLLWWQMPPTHTHTLQGPHSRNSARMLYLSSWVWIILLRMISSCISFPRNHHYSPVLTADNIPEYVGTTFALSNGHKGSRAHNLQHAEPCAVTRQVVSFDKIWSIKAFN